MKPRILIVEDEPAIADTIDYALQTNGCTTLRVTTGGAVADELAQQHIDLSVLDIGLPDIDGIEVCRQVRAHSSVPIIFLTARSDEIDRVVGLEIGADDYVVKPFSPRELAARVKAVLRRTGRDSSADEPVSLFSLDQPRQRIEFCGTPLALSRYEFNLLAVLIDHPGRVFSREQLMNLAWEEPQASMDRTVDAHIKNIRAKLKTIRPDLDPIITHRGIGYALQE